MYQQLLERIDELKKEGNGIAYPSNDEDYWVLNVVKAQAWMASAANSVMQVAPFGSFFRAEMDRLTTDPELSNGIPLRVLQKVLGLLESVQVEARNGLLARLEYQVFATAFDDFLDHASSFHKSGKEKESAILVSVVLEDTLKRIATKNGIEPTGLSLEPLIDELVRKGVFTSVKAKRMKSYSGIRNSALHAEWDKFDLKDVGNVIEGVRELLEDYL